MKNIILLLGLFFSSFCFSQNATTKELVFTKKVIDYGKVSNDTTLIATFIAKNKSSQDVIINYVNPECTCTSYYVSKYDIQPNDTVSITLTIKTTGKFGKEKIYAIVNYGQKKMTKLTVKCDIYEK
ncbi:MAG: DUF1573 domain-containing protein [Bacteroidaceae bacterium]|nr:DUF1573 domain-containing protein [Bacteroidaceae bacterium]